MEEYGKRALIRMMAEDLFTERVKGLDGSLRGWLDECSYAADRSIMAAEVFYDTFNARHPKPDPKHPGPPQGRACT